MKRALVSLAFLTVVACNAPARLGAPCTANPDCQPGHLCLTAAPGGMCTHSCSFLGAGLSECPAGSVCAAVSGSQVCAPICTGANECRDQYECNGASGTTVKACKPKS